MRYLGVVELAPCKRAGTPGDVSCCITLIEIFELNQAVRMVPCAIIREDEAMLILALVQSCPLHQQPWGPL